MVVTLIKELSWCAIIGITAGVFVGILSLIRLMAYLQLRFIIARLISVGIYTDAPDNILNVIYHHKDKLKLGMPDKEVMASEQNKLVYGDLRTRNIVRLDRRQAGDFWVPTKTGDAVILYLEKNPQVLDKKGSSHK